MKTLFKLGIYFTCLPVIMVFVFSGIFITMGSVYWVYFLISMIVSGLLFYGLLKGVDYIEKV